MSRLRSQDQRPGSSSSHIIDTEGEEHQALIRDHQYDDQELANSESGLNLSDSATLSSRKEHLDLYGAKCLLIDREIDKMGMGRYQWYVWSLCGFGYMLDLLWAQAFGLVLSPVQQEFGFGNDQTARISMAFSIGMTAGAFFWGFVADIVGRQWAFNVTVLFAAVFGVCLGLPTSYTPFLSLTVFIGFGVGEPNALPSCYNVAAGQACCHVSTNYGWRYLLFTLGGMTSLGFILRTVVFQFKESPKYLIHRGRDREAVEVLLHIATFNKTTSSITLQAFQDMDYEQSSDEADDQNSPEVVRGDARKSLGVDHKFSRAIRHFKLLFDAPQMACLTILVWLTYIFDFSGFTVAGVYLPRILALKNGAIDLSLRYTYRSYIYIYLPGTTGVAIGSFLFGLPHVGRKWTMAASSFLMGISILIFSMVNTQTSNIVLSALMIFFQSILNSVLYGWTPEAFPAPVRATAAGMASFWGRLVTIFSLSIAQSLYANSVSGIGDVNAVLYFAGGITMCCVVTTALLPSKSLNK